MKIKTSTLFGLLMFFVGTGYTQSFIPVGGALNSSGEALFEFSGKLYVGGNFTSIGTSNAYFLAEWGGTSYTDYNTTLIGGLGMMDFEEHNGNLMVGGVFNLGTGPAMCAEWTGSTFTGTSYKLNSNVNALESYGGDLYVGGAFTTYSSVNYNHIARHNGSSYQTMGDGFNNTVYDIVEYNGDIIAGGTFTQSGTTSVSRIARWNGSAWVAMGSGIGGTVWDMEVYDGDLYVAGNFTTAGGVTARYIAKWDGSTWSEVGGSIQGGANGARALHVHNLELYVGGDFTGAGGIGANNVAKWNGTNWSALGWGISKYVFDIASLGTDVYAVTGSIGTNQLYKWSATASGIPENEDLVSLNVYPVPAEDMLTVTMESHVMINGTVELINILGAVVSSATVNDQIINIDVSDLPVGNYVLQFTSDTVVLSKQILIK